MSIPALLSLLVEDGMRREALAACENAGTVRECLERLPQETADAAVKILKQRAEHMIRKWTGGADVEIQVLSWEYEKWQI